MDAGYDDIDFVSDITTEELQDIGITKKGITLYHIHTHHDDIEIALQILLSIAALYYYSWKYWQELNLAVEPKIANARILADLNLAVRNRITIRIIIYE